MRDTRSDAIRQRVLSKVAAALAELELVLHGLDADGRERTQAAWEGRRPRVLAGDTEKDKKCPACHRRGTLSYVDEQDDEPQFETNYNRNGEPESQDAYYFVTGVPVLFACPVCGLVLEDEELSVFPPMDETIDLDPVDVEWEPDEDYWRGR